MEVQRKWQDDLLRAVLVLNGVDAILTLLWIQLGWATEANPLLAVLAHQMPVIFVATKLTMVSLGVLVLFLHSGRSLARVAAVGSFAAYTAICLYHVSFVVQIAGAFVL